MVREARFSKDDAGGYELPTSPDPFDECDDAVLDGFATAEEGIESTEKRKRRRKTEEKRRPDDDAPHPNPDATAWPVDRDHQDQEQPE